MTTTSPTNYPPLTLTMVVSSMDFPGEEDRALFLISDSLVLESSPLETRTSCKAFIFCLRLSIVPSD